MKTVLALLIVTIGALAPVVTSGSAGAPAIKVTEEGGVYHVVASFVVPEPPETALSVLKDYEAIPRFMPDLRLSRVRERDGARVLVEQEGVSRMMMFSKRVHLVLDIQEEDDALRFTDVCGRSFSHYAGAWLLHARGTHSTIRYELSAKPAFSVPEFLLTRLLKRDAAVMIERLRQEIAARGR